MHSTQSTHPQQSMPPRATQPGHAEPMQPSHTIARLVGPVLATVGIGMLVNGGVYRDMAGQFLAG